MGHLKTSRCLVILISGVMVFTEASHVPVAFYEQNLTRDLLANYNRVVIPRDYSDDVIEVGMVLNVRNILNLDEKSEILSLNGWVNISWSDFRLSWDESMHGGVSGIYLLRSQVWVPDIVLSNTVSKIEVIGDKDGYLYVESDGYVTWFPGDVFSTKCTVDTTQFPFDEQLCVFTLQPWDHVIEEVKIVAADARPSIYKEHGEWQVIEISTEITQNDAASTAEFSISLARRSRFYVLNVILPLIMTTILNSFVFLLPPESGEKIGLATALFLSYAVFLNVIAGYMPTTSNSMSILGVFVSLQLLLSALSIMCSVVILRGHLNANKSQKLNALSRTLDKVCFVAFVVLGVMASIILLIVLIAGNN